jgi:two-component system response regulator NreC
VRVLLADDHVIVREGLKKLLDGEPDITVVGEAADGIEALEKAKASRPDVVVIDITMPRLSGLEAVPLIKEALSDVKIVVLSMHKREAYVHQVFSSGALAYVLKASSSDEILEAVRTAYRGEYFLSSKIRSDVINVYLKSDREKPVVRGYDLLSEREQQVFRLVVEGNSTDTIADILCISPKTVEKHRSSVMKKLDIHDVLGLIKYAVKVGIVDPELWQD